MARKKASEPKSTANIGFEAKLWLAADNPPWVRRASPDSSSDSKSLRMVDSLTSSESLSSGIETNPCCRINSSIRALRAIDVLTEV